MKVQESSFDKFILHIIDELEKYLNRGSKQVQKELSTTANPRNNVPTLTHGYSYLLVSEASKEDSFSKYLNKLKGYLKNKAKVYAQSEKGQEILKNVAADIDANIYEEVMAFLPYVALGLMFFIIIALTGLTKSIIIYLILCCIIIAILFNTKKLNYVVWVPWTSILLTVMITEKFNIFKATSFIIQRAKENKAALATALSLTLAAIFFALKKTRNLMTEQLLKHVDILKRINTKISNI